MVGLAERLVALREVVAFLHFEAFERLDHLRRVGAAVEFASHHGDFRRVQGFIVRLHVAVG